MKRNVRKFAETFKNVEHSFFMRTLAWYLMALVEATWKSLNRLCTGMGRSKTNLSKWGYAARRYIACECGTSEQTMQHLLRCPLLENECSLEDLATANEKALNCARAWPNIWPSSGMMDTKKKKKKVVVNIKEPGNGFIHIVRTNIQSEPD